MTSAPCMIRAGIINATTPLWTVVLGLAVRHQRSVTGWQAAGLVVGFAGAVLIFTSWHRAWDRASRQARPGPSGRTAYGRLTGPDAVMIC